MKLVSLNIEGHRHLEQRVIPFLVAEQPDILCLQELFYVDIPAIVAKTGLEFVHFIPVADVTEGNKNIPDALGLWGLAQFVRPGVVKARSLPAMYYRPRVGQPITDLTLSLDEQRELWRDNPVPKFMGDREPNAADKVLLQMEVTLIDSGKVLEIVTTHFTWSPKGVSTPEQLEHAHTLLSFFTRNTDNTVLCGDFNAPRGGQTFQLFAERWIDNIPKQYTTSIDENLHMRGKIELMVDGLFSDPEVKFSSVRLQDGVSDHMAIVAEIA